MNKRKTTLLQPVRARLLATPLGQILLEANQRGLTKVHFCSGSTARRFRQQVHPAHRVDTEAEKRAERILDQAENILTRYFAGKNVSLTTIPVAPSGTDFQQTVWTALRSIPRGATLDYSALAKRAGSPRAVRAAASACKNNPIAIFVPCHRVIRKNQQLGGYNAGVKRKAFLLQLEQS